jgi:hypothetical protein
MSPGTLVAAKVGKENEWILATIVTWNGSKQKYEIEDVEEEESESKQKYLVTTKSIVPLHLTDEDALASHEFQEGEEVLALFPQTTCLYTAFIAQTPSTTKSKNYLVTFEDDEEEGTENPQRSVEARFIIERQ